MLSLAPKLHAKYASDLLPVLKAYRQGSTQKLNCEVGGAFLSVWIRVGEEKRTGASQ